MYSKIINPASGRFVSVNGKLGKEILKNYLNYSNKIWFRLHGGAVGLDEGDTLGAEEVAANGETEAEPEQEAEAVVETKAEPEQEVVAVVETKAEPEQESEAVVETKAEPEQESAVTGDPAVVVEEKASPTTEQGNDSWWSKLKFWGGGSYTNEDFGQPFDYFKA